MTDGGRRGDSKYRSAARHRAAWRRPESHRTVPAAPCADLCQQLLFKGNVDQVVIRDHSELGAKVVTKIGTTESAPPFARGYVETTIAPFW
jgi:hypothetical protein